MSRPLRTRCCAQSCRIKRLVEECAAMQVVLVARRLVLRRLTSESLADEEQRQSIMRLLREQMPPAPGDVEFQEWRKHPAAIAWDALRARLGNDPDAPLDVYGV
jgi:hypothetical protein